MHLEFNLMDHFIAYGGPKIIIYGTRNCKYTINGPLLHQSSTIKSHAVYLDKKGEQYVMQTNEYIYISKQRIFDINYKKKKGC